MGAGAEAAVTAATTGTFLGTGLLLLLFSVSECPASLGTKGKIRDRGGLLAREDWGCPYLSGKPERRSCHSKGVPLHSKGASLLNPSPCFSSNKYDPRSLVLGGSHGELSCLERNMSIYTVGVRDPRGALQSGPVLECPLNSCLWESFCVAGTRLPDSGVAN